MPKIRNPSRVASPSIAGHRYAFLVTANLWTQLTDGQQLVVEGNEDIDVIDVGSKANRCVHEVQVKGNSGTFGPKNAIVYHTLLNFLAAWCQHCLDGHAFKATLCTTATFKEVRASPIGEWVRGGTPDLRSLQRQVITLLEKHATRANGLNINVIREPSAFARFIECVEWVTDAENAAAQRRALEEALRNRVPDLDPSVAADAVLEAVLAAASGATVEARTLERRMLSQVLNETTIRTLAERAATPQRIEFVIAEAVTPSARACCLIAVALRDFEPSASRANNSWGRASDGDLLAVLAPDLDFVAYVAVARTANQDNTCHASVVRQARYAYPLAKPTTRVNRRAQQLAKRFAHQIAQRCIDYDVGGQSLTTLRPFITKLRWLKTSSGNVLTASELLPDLENSS